MCFSHKHFISSRYILHAVRRALSPQNQVQSPVRKGKRVGHRKGPALACNSPVTAWEWVQGSEPTEDCRPGGTEVCGGGCCRAGPRRWVLLGVGGRKSGTWVPPGSWRYAGGEGKQQDTGPEQPRPRGFWRLGQEGQSRLDIQQGHPPVLLATLPAMAPLGVSTSEWGSCSASWRCWAGGSCTEGAGDGVAFTPFCSWTNITARPCNPSRNALGWHRKDQFYVFGSSSVPWMQTVGTEFSKILITWSYL